MCKGLCTQYKQQRRLDFGELAYKTHRTGKPAFLLKQQRILFRNITVQCRDIVFHTVHFVLHITDMRQTVIQLYTDVMQRFTAGLDLLLGLGQILL